MSLTVEQMCRNLLEAHLRMHDGLTDPQSYSAGDLGIMAGLLSQYLQQHSKPPPCDQDVYRKGEVVCIAANVPTAIMERACKDVSHALGQPVDWHYAAGRAVVKTIGDVERVRKLFSWIDQAQTDMGQRHD